MMQMVASRLGWMGTTLFAQHFYVEIAFEMPPSLLNDVLKLPCSPYKNFA